MNESKNNIKGCDMLMKIIKLYTIILGLIKKEKKLKGSIYNKIANGSYIDYDNSSEKENDNKKLPFETATDFIMK